MFGFSSKAPLHTNLIFYGKKYCFHSDVTVRILYSNHPTYRNKTSGGLMLTVRFIINSNSKENGNRSTLFYGEILVNVKTTSHIPSSISESLRRNNINEI